MSEFILGVIVGSIAGGIPAYYFYCRGNWIQEMLDDLNHYHNP